VDMRDNDLRTQTSWTCRSIPPLLSSLSGPRQQVRAR
jgi:hypothetical protein